MSSSDIPRRALLTVALVALAGCGFTPVYGPGGGGAALRAAIRPTEPDTDLTFAFVRQFEERLGRAVVPMWELDYTIVTSDEALAIDGSNNITRYNIEGWIDWTVTPVGSSSVMLSGRDSTFTSYSATGSTISTLESERDAQRRLARILADKVVTRLLAEAATLAQ
ncbi:LPS-assembly lipoprotein [Jannaschia faecimaris]|uniref:LPS-assembly lipoprotein n=1 Tax=Jannaschia faecimaris TaxID=1244108 RepID=A0A1H3IVB9_9RHOB|nr:LPS assembly lipoprotein LptE [Jannaschia faecimaris]SDY31189.1 LPS-assembly lipoprotein [Jannaschia faecimaris]